MRVPPGFCVTTEAYERVVADSTEVREALDRLAGLPPGDTTGLAWLCAQVRLAIEDVTIPDAVAAEVETALDRLGRDAPDAVRSAAAGRGRSDPAAAQHRAAARGR